MEIRTPQNQDIPQPAMPDRDWAHTRPLPPMVPNQERLNKQSETVTVRNTDLRTTHIVIDRYLQPVELKPGHSRQCEMLVEDIEYFARQRKPGRISVMGTPCPEHPVIIEGITDGVSISEYDDARNKAQEQLAKTAQANTNRGHEQNKSQDKK